MSENQELNPTNQEQPEEEQEEVVQDERIVLASTTETRNLNEIMDQTGNLYESIAIVAKRSNQINVTMKEELTQKLNEFASTTDNLEEIFENREQIEISRYYEKMANPAIQSLQEFLNEETYYRKRDDNRPKELNINVDDIDEIDSKDEGKKEDA